MFKNLGEEIKYLNSNINDVANYEKAKKLRKKLLTIGISLLACGIIGTIVSFVLFIVFGVNAMESMSGFPKLIIIPIITIFLSGICLSIGSVLISLGLKIVVTGYTTELIDETVGNRCPKCGDAIQPGEIYCDKCGTPVRKVCPNCQNINDPNSGFCSKCGTKLG